MPISAPYSLTDCRRFFAKPATPRQRQYEALRAFYVEGMASADCARRFGYSSGAFRVLCHAFRRGELPEFFASARPGRREQPKKSRAHEQIVALRKRNYSVYEISQSLKEKGTPLSATAVREVLAEEGFAPLPRRLDEERPARISPNAQAVANVNDFVLSPREFTTRTGGLFLFVPDLVRLESDALAQTAIDALSSSVGLKVDFDMALLVLASSLYRLMARRMRGYNDAQARQIFRDLIDMPADIAITENEIRVRFHRRAHLPIVLASGLFDKPVSVPWWGGRSLRLVQ